MLPWIALPDGVAQMMEIDEKKLLDPRRKSQQYPPGTYFFA